MSRILLAWEFGGGLGHLDILRQSGDRLVEDGHEVVAAVRDCERAAGRLGDIPYLPAPVRPPPGARRGATRTIAHILHNVAFDREEYVWGRLRAWMEIIRRTQPDCVVADYAPGALMAARHLGLPTVAMGNGFYLPPVKGPLARLPLITQKGSEPSGDDETPARVLEAVNGALRRLGADEISEVQEMFTADRYGVTSYPELDPSSDYREAVEFWGPPPAARGGATPPWGPGEGPKAVAYLKAFDTLPDLIRACGSMGLRLTAYLPPEARPAVESVRYDGLVLSDQPLDLASLAEEADLAIHNATHGTACAMLERGLPSLLLPIHQEQLLTAQRIEALGGGLNAPLKRPRPMAEKLARLRDEPAFREAASGFAAQHPPGASDPFARLVEAVAGLV